MNEFEKSILQEIVARDGHCMDTTRCSMCPFRNKCIPSFLEEPISKQVRVNMATDAIAHNFLLEDEVCL